MANSNDSAIIREMLRLPNDLCVRYFAQNSHRIIDDATYWNVLGTLWKDGGTVVQQELWRPLFQSKRKKREKIMKKRERQRWRNLPAVVMAYRAVNSLEEADYAISWTLSKEIAERVFDERGKRPVVERKFKKSEIFAFFDRRGEEEILVYL